MIAIDWKEQKESKVGPDISLSHVTLYRGGEWQLLPVLPIMPMVARIACTLRIKIPTNILKSTTVRVITRELESGGKRLIWDAPLASTHSFRAVTSFMKAAALRFWKYFASATHVKMR